MHNDVCKVWMNHSVRVSTLFVSALLGEGISKIRLFINELEVTWFFFGNLKQVSTRNFWKDYKLQLQLLQIFS